MEGLLWFFHYAAVSSGGGEQYFGFLAFFCSSLWFLETTINIQNTGNLLEHTAQAVCMSVCVEYQLHAHESSLLYLWTGEKIAK
jgi:hypothetical protein